MNLSHTLLGCFIYLTGTLTSQSWTPFLELAVAIKLGSTGLKTAAWKADSCRAMHIDDPKRKILPFVLVIISLTQYSCRKINIKLSMENFENAFSYWYILSKSSTNLAAILQPIGQSRHVALVILAH